MDVYRTPDERFTDLPGYPWEPRYASTYEAFERAAYRNLQR